MRPIVADVALSIHNVDKIYQRRGKPPVHAVKALRMEVNKGEIVALLGSSGCGKTSTLRMIAGFEEVTGGEIKLAGRRIDKLPPSQRGVTMAFEGYSLYPPLTVGDNIAFALKSLVYRTKRSNAPSSRSRLLSRSTRSSTAIPLRFPADSSNALRLRALWCAMLTFTCLTNQWGSSSRSFAPCCGAG